MESFSFFDTPPQSDDSKQQKSQRERTSNEPTADSQKIQAFEEEVRAGCITEDPNATKKSDESNKLKDKASTSKTRMPWEEFPSSELTKADKPRNEEPRSFAHKKSSSGNKNEFTSKQDMKKSSDKKNSSVFKDKKYFELNKDKSKTLLNSSDDENEEDANLHCTEDPNALLTKKSDESNKLKDKASTSKTRMPWEERPSSVLTKADKPKNDESRSFAHKQDIKKSSSGNKNEFTSKQDMKKSSDKKDSSVFKDKKYFELNKDKSRTLLNSSDDENEEDAKLHCIEDPNALLTKKSDESNKLKDKASTSKTRMPWEECPNSEMTKADKPRNEEPRSYAYKQDIKKSSSGNKNEFTSKQDMKKSSDKKNSSVFKDKKYFELNKDKSRTLLNSSDGENKEDANLHCTEDPNALLTKKSDESNKLKDKASTSKTRMPWEERPSSELTKADKPRNEEPRSLAHKRDIKKSSSGNKNEFTSKKDVKKSSDKKDSSVFKDKKYFELNKDKSRTLLNSSDDENEEDANLHCTEDPNALLTKKSDKSKKLKDKASTSKTRMPWEECPNSELTKADKPRNEEPRSFAHKKSSSGNKNEFTFKQDMKKSSDKKDSSVFKDKKYFELNKDKSRTSLNSSNDENEENANLYCTEDPNALLTKKSDESNKLKDKASTSKTRMPWKECPSSELTKADKPRNEEPRSFAHKQDIKKSSSGNKNEFTSKKDIKKSSDKKDSSVFKDKKYFELNKDKSRTLLNSSDDEDKEDANLHCTEDPNALLTKKSDESNKLKDKASTNKTRMPWKECPSSELTKADKPRNEEPKSFAHKQDIKKSSSGNKNEFTSKQDMKTSSHKKDSSVFKDKKYFELNKDKSRTLLNSSDDEDEEGAKNRRHATKNKDKREDLLKDKKSESAEGKRDKKLSAKTSSDKNKMVKFGNNSKSANYKDKRYNQDDMPIKDGTVKAVTDEDNKNKKLIKAKTNSNKNKIVTFAKDTKFADNTNSSQSNLGSIKAVTNSRAEENKTKTDSVKFANNTKSANNKDNYKFFYKNWPPIKQSKSRESTASTSKVKAYSTANNKQNKDKKSAEDNKTSSSKIDLDRNANSNKDKKLPNDKDKRSNEEPIKDKRSSNIRNAEISGGKDKNYLFVSNKDNASRNKKSAQLPSRGNQSESDGDESPIRNKDKRYTDKKASALYKDLMRKLFSGSESKESSDNENKDKRYRDQIASEANVYRKRDKSRNPNKQLETSSEDEAQTKKYMNKNQDKNVNRIKPSDDSEDELQLHNKDKALIKRKNKELIKRSQPSQSSDDEESNEDRRYTDQRRRASIKNRRKSIARILSSEESSEDEVRYRTIKDNAKMSEDEVQNKKPRASRARTRKNILTRTSKESRDDEVIIHEKCRASIARNPQSEESDEGVKQNPRSSIKDRTRKSIARNLQSEESDEGVKQNPRSSIKDRTRKSIVRRDLSRASIKHGNRKPIRQSEESGDEDVTYINQKPHSSIKDGKRKSIVRNQQSDESEDFSYINQKPRASIKDRRKSIFRRQRSKEMSDDEELESRASNKESKRKSFARIQQSEENDIEDLSYINQVRRDLIKDRKIIATSQQSEETEDEALSNINRRRRASIKDRKGKSISRRHHTKDDVLNKLEDGIEDHDLSYMNEKPSKSIIRRQQLLETSEDEDLSCEHEQPHTSITDRKRKTKRQQSEDNGDEELSCVRASIKDRKRWHQLQGEVSQFEEESENEELSYLGRTSFASSKDRKRPISRNQQISDDEDGRYINQGAISRLNESEESGEDEEQMRDASNQNIKRTNSKTCVLTKQSRNCSCKNYKDKRQGEEISKKDCASNKNRKRSHAESGDLMNQSEMQTLKHPKFAKISESRIQTKQRKQLDKDNFCIPSTSSTSTFLSHDSKSCDSVDFTKPVDCHCGFNIWLGLRNLINNEEKRGVLKNKICRCKNADETKVSNELNPTLQPKMTEEAMEEQKMHEEAIRKQKLHEEAIPKQKLTEEAIPQKIVTEQETMTEDACNKKSLLAQRANRRFMAAWQFQKKRKLLKRSSSESSIFGCLTEDEPSQKLSKHKTSKEDLEKVRMDLWDKYGPISKAQDPDASLLKASSTEDAAGGVKMQEACTVIGSNPLKFKANKQFTRILEEDEDTETCTVVGGEKNQGAKATTKFLQAPRIKDKEAGPRNLKDCSLKTQEACSIEEHTEGANKTNSLSSKHQEANGGDTKQRASRIKDREACITAREYEDFYAKNLEDCSSKIQEVSSIKEDKKRTTFLSSKHTKDRKSSTVKKLVEARSTKNIDSRCKTQAASRKKSTGNSSIVTSRILEVRNKLQNSTTRDFEANSAKMLENICPTFPKCQLEARSKSSERNVDSENLNVNVVPPKINILQDLEVEITKNNTKNSEFCTTNLVSFNRKSSDKIKEKYLDNNSEGAAVESLTSSTAGNGKAAKLRSSESNRNENNEVQKPETIQPASIRRYKSSDRNLETTKSSEATHLEASNKLEAKPETAAVRSSKTIGTKNFEAASTSSESSKNKKYISKCSEAPNKLEAAKSSVSDNKKPAENLKKGKPKNARSSSTKNYETSKLQGITKKYKQAPNKSRRDRILKIGNDVKSFRRDNSRNSKGFNKTSNLSLETSEMILLKPEAFRKSNPKSKVNLNLEPKPIGKIPINKEDAEQSSINSENSLLSYIRLSKVSSKIQKCCESLEALKFYSDLEDPKNTSQQEEQFAKSSEMSNKKIQAKEAETSSNCKKNYNLGECSENVFNIGALSFEKSNQVNKKIEASNNEDSTSCNKSDELEETRISSSNENSIAPNKKENSEVKKYNFRPLKVYKNKKLTKNLGTVCKIKNWNQSLEALKNYSSDESDEDLLKVLNLNSKLSGSGSSNIDQIDLPQKPKTPNKNRSSINKNVEASNENFKPNFHKTGFLQKPRIKNASNKTQSSITNESSARFLQKLEKRSRDKNIKIVKKLSSSASSKIQSSRQKNQKGNPNKICKPHRNKVSFESSRSRFRHLHKPFKKIAAFTKISEDIKLFCRKILSLHCAINNHKEKESLPDIRSSGLGYTGENLKNFNTNEDFASNTKDSEKAKKVPTSNPAASCNGSSKSTKDNDSSLADISTSSKASEGVDSSLAKSRLSVGTASSCTGSSKTEASEKTKEKLCSITSNSSGSSKTSKTVGHQGNINKKPEANREAFRKLIDSFIAHSNLQQSPKACPKATTVKTSGEASKNTAIETENTQKSIRDDKRVSFEEDIRKKSDSTDNAPKKKLSTKPKLVEEINKRALSLETSKSSSSNLEPSSKPSIDKEINNRALSLETSNASRSLEHCTKPNVNKALTLKIFKASSGNLEYSIKPSVEEETKNGASSLETSKSVSSKSLELSTKPSKTIASSSSLKPSTKPSVNEEINERALETSQVRSSETSKKVTEINPSRGRIEEAFEKFGYNSQPSKNTPNKADSHKSKQDRIYEAFKKFSRPSHSNSNQGVSSKLNSSKATNQKSLPKESLENLQSDSSFKATNKQHVASGSSTKKQESKTTNKQATNPEPLKKLKISTKGLSVEPSIFEKALASTSDYRVIRSTYVEDFQYPKYHKFPCDLRRKKSKKSKESNEVESNDNNKQENVRKHELKVSKKRLKAKEHAKHRKLTKNNFKNILEANKEHKKARKEAEASKVSNANVNNKEEAPQSLASTSTAALLNSIAFPRRYFKKFQQSKFKKRRKTILMRAEDYFSDSNPEKLPESWTNPPVCNQEVLLNKEEYRSLRILRNGKVVDKSGGPHDGVIIQESYPTFEIFDENLYEFNDIEEAALVEIDNDTELKYLHDIMHPPQIINLENEELLNRINKITDNDAFIILDETELIESYDQNFEEKVEINGEEIEDETSKPIKNCDQQDEKLNYDETTNGYKDEISPAPIVCGNFEEVIIDGNLSNEQKETEFEETQGNELRPKQFQEIIFLISKVGDTSLGDEDLIVPDEDNSKNITTEEAGSDSSHEEKQFPTLSKENTEFNLTQPVSDGTIKEDPPAEEACCEGGVSESSTPFIHKPPSGLNRTIKEDPAVEEACCQEGVSESSAPFIQKPPSDLNGTIKEEPAEEEACCEGGVSESLTPFIQKTPSHLNGTIKEDLAVEEACCQEGVSESSTLFIQKPPSDLNGTIKEDPAVEEAYCQEGVSESSASLIQKSPSDLKPSEIKANKQQIVAEVGHNLSNGNSAKFNIRNLLGPASDASEPQRVEPTIQIKNEDFLEPSVKVCNQTAKESAKSVETLNGRPKKSILDYCNEKTSSRIQETAIATHSGWKQKNGEVEAESNKLVTGSKPTEPSKRANVLAQIKPANKRKPKKSQATIPEWLIRRPPSVDGVAKPAVLPSSYLASNYLSRQGFPDNLPFPYQQRLQVNPAVVRQETTNRDVSEAVKSGVIENLDSENYTDITIDPSEVCEAQLDLDSSEASISITDPSQFQLQQSQGIPVCNIISNPGFNQLTDIASTQSTSGLREHKNRWGPRASCNFQQSRFQFRPTFATCCTPSQVERSVQNAGSISGQQRSFNYNEQQRAAPQIYSSYNIARQEENRRRTLYFSQRTPTNHHVLQFQSPNLSNNIRPNLYPQPHPPASTGAIPQASSPTSTIQSRSPAEPHRQQRNQPPQSSSGLPPPPPMCRISEHQGQVPPPPPMFRISEQQGQVPPPPPMCRISKQQGQVPPPSPMCRSSDLSQVPRPPPAGSSETSRQLEMQRPTEGVITSCPRPPRPASRRLLTPEPISYVLNGRQNQAELIAESRINNVNRLYWFNREKWEAEERRGRNS